MLDTKKNIILYVLKILLKYTDSEHSMTQKEIIYELENKYFIVVERKSLSNTIKVIEDFLDNNDFFGLSLTHTNKGVYIDSRLFDKTEIQYLIDAVFSSKSLGTNFSNEIITKLQRLLPKYENKQYIVSKPKKINSEMTTNILYNVDVIQECIKNHKQVKFEYKDSYLKEFHVDPYYLINRNGQYYLFGAKGNKENTSEYRIDKMSKVEQRSKPRRELITLSEVPNDFDINKYLDEHPYGFDDEIIRAVITGKDDKSLSYLNDWFGEKLPSKTIDGRKCKVIKCDRSSLVILMLQYSDYLELLEPVEIREELKLKGLQINKIYQ